MVGVEIAAVRKEGLVFKPVKFNFDASASSYWNGLGLRISNVLKDAVAFCFEIKVIVSKQELKIIERNAKEAF